MYKLPDYEANYCLFHNKEVSVTGFVGRISGKQQKLLQNFISENTKLNNFKLQILGMNNIAILYQTSFLQYLA